MKSKGRSKDILVQLRKNAAEIYLAAMLLIYPLYMGSGYAELIYRKWDFFLYVSLIFIIVSIVLNIAIAIADRKKKRITAQVPERGNGIVKTKLVWTDIMVFVYLVCVFISYAGALNREYSFVGIPTWYMGLVSQFIFVCVYFCISRGLLNGERIKLFAVLSGGVFSIICGIILLQRFGFDVFYLYKEILEEEKPLFIVTMGQVTWTSVYVTVMLCAGMGIYLIKHTYKKTIFKAATEVCMGIGFAAVAVLNCDSAVIALVCVFFLLLWLAFYKKERMLAFIRIVITALMAVILTGWGEKIFYKRMQPIDEIYLKTAGSPYLLLILAAAVLCYLLLKKGRLPFPMEEKQIRTVHIILLILLSAAACGLIALFVLHGKGYFPDSPSENYFHFTVWWGNSRGFIWRIGAAVFSDFSIWRKLFGCGPDGFMLYAYELMGDSINEFWHNQIVTTVHNEWFGAVINYGLLGGAAYLGIFLASAKHFLTSGAKRAKENPILLGIGLAAAAYIAHNILCYQQLVGTPVVFVLLGAGQAFCQSGAASDNT